MASGMCSVAATSVAEITHRSDAATTIRCKECLPSAPGMLSAATTAPAPKLANSSPKPPASRWSWFFAITGSNAYNELAHSANVKLRSMIARIGEEWRT